MNWKSNFTAENLRRIAQILRYNSQIGYEKNSDLWIFACMISILDNTESEINDKPEIGLLRSIIKK